MEALHDSQPQDADTGMPGDLDYAAAAAAAGTSSRDGQTGLLPRAAAPAARRDEVQRLFCSVLVVRWDLNTPYAAPVIIMSQEGSNIYQVLERHLRRDYLVGAEKFWRLVRAELGVDTWRPRVQGAQLKALQSARLPESEQEFQNIQLVVEGLQDCLLPESSTDALMSDLRTTISQIQAWWETRNKRPDGNFKRTGPTPAGASFQLQQPSKRRAVTVPSYTGLDQQLPLTDAAGQLDVAADPAAAAAAAQAAALAAAPFMALGPGELPVGLRYPFTLLNGLEQPLAATSAAAAAGGGGSGGPVGAASGAGALDSSLLGAAAGAAGAEGNPLSPFLAAPGGLLVLDVGGKVFRTTLNTLLAVRGSLFWQVCYNQVPPGVMQRLPSGDVFIDRSGEHFSYVLEYLRACACNDITFPMPNDARDLQALAREAFFYQLSDLVGHIQDTVIMPHPSTRTFYDMAYLETGFQVLTGSEVTAQEVERHKVVLMQQLNHMVHEMHLEGFAVEQVLPGVSTREGPDGAGMEHNLYYNVLLKKVVPLLPQEMAGDDDEQQGEGEAQRQRQQQQHYSAGSGAAVAAGGGRVV